MAEPLPFLRRISLLSLPGLLALTGNLGCVPPEVHLPQPPTQGEARAAATLQSQTIPMARDAVFSKVMGVLLDMGYQVRCANQELGQVNIEKSWVDKNQSTTPHVKVEATLLFLPDGPSATTVRMLASGHWTALLKGDGESTGVAPTLATAECRAFLEQLAERLRQAH